MIANDLWVYFAWRGPKEMAPSGCQEEIWILQDPEFYYFFAWRTIWKSLDLLRVQKT